MTSISQPPDFYQINQSLQTIKATASAAEAHGLLCGFICAGRNMDGKSLVEPILGKADINLPAVANNKELLLELYEFSSQKLQSMEFDFQLLLPRDSEPLSIRAEALSHWCQGFLIGLKFADIDVSTGFSEESRDVFHHLFEISKLDFDDIDVTEEDEKAFFEVSEYVRMAAIMVYSEIADNQSKQRTVH